MTTRSSPPTALAAKSVNPRSVNDDADESYSDHVCCLRRKAHAEPTTVGPAVLENERAGVRFCDPPRDRQAEARAGSAAGGIELNESIENPRAIRGRDAGAAVGDADGDAFSLVSDIDRHDAAGWRVLHGVLQHVQH